jgi:hypothetical protein
MELIKITNGTQKPYSMGQLRRDNKTVSFPKIVDPATLESYGVFSAVEADIPTYNRISQSITRAETAVKVAGQWTYNWIVTNKSTKELAAINRAERDKRLAQCDWVVTKALEAGTSVASDWVTYRTTLRDITTHANWPNLVYPDMDGSGGDWPTSP